MTKQNWQELKETITELRDSDGTLSQQEVCKFLVRYMEVLEQGDSMQGQVEVQHEDDTLWIDVEELLSLEDIGKIERVILTHGCWYSEYYLAED